MTRLEGALYATTGVTLILLFGAIYVYGSSTLDAEVAKRGVKTEQIRISECVSNYTGEDETKWAWTAYTDTTSEDIAKTTGVNINVINECLRR